MCVGMRRIEIIYTRGGVYGFSFIFYFNFNIFFQYYEVIWSFSIILDGINAHWTLRGVYELIGEGIWQLELELGA
jgi:hypothetical protein